MNITLSELKRIYKKPKYGGGYWFIPQCDCPGGDVLNTCASQCRINRVYRMVLHFNGYPFPNKDDYEQILGKKFIYSQGKILRFF